MSATRWTPPPSDVWRAGGPACPLGTHDLPGIGGALDGVPEHFRVDEVPAYPPSGEGDHWFVRVQKRDLTTPALREMMAAAAGCDPRDIGVAGRKDRHAVTTQWLSLPVEPVDPADERVTLLEQARHQHKLRMGHLRSNRFEIRLRGVHADAAARLPALRARLEAGVPNYFGPQRFGRTGLGDVTRLLARQRVRDPRFTASTLQSAVFNAWLGERVQAGRLHTAVLGDVLRKRATGGLFICADLDLDAARVAAGEVDPCGPLFGPKLFAAAAEAAETEARALSRFSLDEAQSGAIGRFAPGGRRPARLVPEDLDLALDGEDLVARFALPSGAYATSVLAELAHPEAGWLTGPELEA
mgnify:CR=1 FL=1